LHQQVEQLGDIDARAINTIEIGGGFNVRVGRYGPYLEDMNEKDAEGNPRHASIPDTIAPDELTVEVARELIENNSNGSRELGTDPATGFVVEVRNGRFGPYVALIDPAAEGKTKPKMASLFKSMDPATIGLEDALKLLSLPRTVGTIEEPPAAEGTTEGGTVSQAVVTASNGRYGPYLTKTSADGKSDNRSLGSEDEIFTVDIQKAKELFAQPKYGARSRSAKPPLREFGLDPESGKQVTIKDGFYGVYITDGTTNRTLPKQYTPESVTEEEAFRLLAEKRAAGPSKRRTRGASRSTAKSAAKGSAKSSAKGATTKSTKTKSAAARSAKKSAAKAE
jgi:DNA topoisomerase-1